MNLSLLIPVYIDGEDRLNNLQLVVSYLRHHLPHAEIILSELDKDSKIINLFPTCKHIFTETTDFFNKQKAFNIAAKSAKNDIICLYDVDVLVDIDAIKKSVNFLESNRTDLIWPYNGKFYDIPKNLHSIIKNSKNIKEIKIEDCTLFSDRSVGGAVFIKKNIFFEGGGGNENFKGAGWEDNEIYERFTILGYRRARLDTFLLHLNHDRKETSYNFNPHGTHNQNEFVRIRAKSKSQLLEEIKNWSWCK